MNLLITPAQAIGHKSYWFRNSFSRILRKSGNKKMISFCRVWYLVVWYASNSNLLQLQTCQTFSMSKNTSPKIVILRNHLYWCLGAHWSKIAHFSKTLWTITPFLTNINGTLLSHTLSLNRNDVNNPWTKRRPLFKTILTWEVVLQSGRPSMAYVVARSRRIMRTKKMNKKKNWLSCHVMHLKNSIESKRKSRKPNSKKF